MRASIGGWVANSAMKPGLVGNAEARQRLWAARRAGSPPRRASACIIGCGVPRYLALPASARNSRWRENQATMIDGQHSEDDLADEDGEVVARADATRVRNTVLSTMLSDDAGQKNDEGVDDALDKRQRHHVAVGHVRDLMTQREILPIDFKSRFSSLTLALQQTLSWGIATNDRADFSIPAANERSVT